MKIKVSKKAICLTAFKSEKEKSHGDLVQFSLVPQRLEPEAGGEQGHAAQQAREATD